MLYYAEHYGIKIVVAVPSINIYFHGRSVLRIQNRKPLATGSHLIFYFCPFPLELNIKF